jgi:hypothetical protein
VQTKTTEQKNELNPQIGEGLRCKQAAKGFPTPQHIQTTYQSFLLPQHKQTTGPKDELNPNQMKGSGANKLQKSFLLPQHKQTTDQSFLLPQHKQTTGLKNELNPNQMKGSGANKPQSVPCDTKDVSTWMLETPRILLGLRLFT